MKQLILLLITIIVVSCGKKEPNKAAELADLRKQKSKIETKIAELEKEVVNPNEVKTTNVAVEIVNKKPFYHYVEVQGTVVADEDVMVNAKMPGMLTRVLVKVGDHVGAGQLIAVVDDAITRQSMAELENRLTLANDVYEKQKALWDQKIGSEIQFLTAKNNRDALEKSIATVNQTLSNFQVRAPMAGFVEEVYAKVGNTAAPGVPMMRIINTNKLKVKADIAESLSAKMKQGAVVKLMFPDIQKEYDSRIAYVGKIINQLNRTLKVEASVSANMPGVIPNMVSIMRVADYSNPSAMTVPLNIIQKDASGDYVMIIGANGNQIVAKKAAVKVGKINTDNAEILSGLNNGDKIITQGYQDLNEGDILKM
jgi:membrane fusion protein, multidrug efflux system